MSKEKEIKEKEKRVRKFLNEQAANGLLLSRLDNFAWMTAGGDSHVLMGAETGVASLLITREKKYVITNNIESLRILEEELPGQAYALEEYPWWEENRKIEIIKRLSEGKDFISDDGTAGTRQMVSEIAQLRYSLTTDEIKRYKWLGKKCGKAIGKVCAKIKKGETEFEIAGRMSKEVFKYGITPVVILVAADERISKHRHPIPTDKPVEKTVMAVLCARKWGLIVSLTRIVHFGALSAELKKKHEAVTKVDAAMITASRPGITVGEVLSSGQAVYAQTGFREEWKKHHQGGPCGYASRDYKAIPDLHEKLLANQAVVWNPSITGTKSEDTVIIGSETNEIITASPGWPMIEVKTGSQTIARPDILVI